MVPVRWRYSRWPSCIRTRRVNQRCTSLLDPVGGRDAGHAGQICRDLGDGVQPLGRGQRVGGARSSRSAPSSRSIVMRASVREPGGAGDAQSRPPALLRVRPGHDRSPGVGPASGPATGRREGRDRACGTSGRLGPSTEDRARPRRPRHRGHRPGGRQRLGGDPARMGWGPDRRRGRPGETVSG